MNAQMDKRFGQRVLDGPFEEAFDSGEERRDPSRNPTESPAFHSMHGVSCAVRRLLFGKSVHSYEL